MTELVVDTHRPSPEFREFLEGDVVRAYRRDRMFRRLRSVAIIFAALGVGLTAGLAPAQISENTRRDSLLAAANAELLLTQLRLELAQLQMKETARRAQSGLAEPTLLVIADADLHAMLLKLWRSKLDVEEIRASSQPPRDDLNAPRVAGRDFVAERLEADLGMAQTRLNSAEKARDEVERRVRVGAETQLALMAADLEATRAQAALAALAERRKLRAEFLERGTPADQLMVRLEQQQLRLDAMVAQKALETARVRLAEIEKRVQVGAAGEMEKLQAQLAVKEREVEMELLVRRLRALQK